MYTGAPMNPFIGQIVLIMGIGIRVYYMPVALSKYLLSGSHIVTVKH